MYFVLVWCMVEVVFGVVSSMHRAMAQTKPQNDVDLSGQAVWVIDLFSRVYQLFHALPEMSRFPKTIKSKSWHRIGYSPLIVNVIQQLRDMCICQVICWRGLWVY